MSETTNIAKSADFCPFDEIFSDVFNQIVQCCPEFHIPILQLNESCWRRPSIFDKPIKVSRK